MVPDKKAATERVEYFATGYTREELQAMHPTVKLEPEWVKCPQCSRENSRETWNKFGGKCPNCLDLFDKESGARLGDSAEQEKKMSEPHRCNPPYSGNCVDGQKFTCPTCGWIWTHACDEDEGCYWTTEGKTE